MNLSSFARQFASFRCVYHLIVFAALLTGTSAYLIGQTVTNAGNIGFPPNSVFDGSDFDTVQLNNGNLHIEIPLWSTKGRGALGAGWKYVYDLQSFYVVEHCTTGRNPTCYTNLKIGPGGHAQLSLVGPFNYLAASHSSPDPNCPLNVSNGYLTQNVTLQEPDGTRHHFVPDPVCVIPPFFYADDGSGWVCNNSIGKCFRKDGAVPEWDANPTTLTDSNGNQISLNTATLTGTDTLGRAVPTDGSYYDSSAAHQLIQVTTTSVAVHTNSSADNNIVATWTVPQTITLPNGMTYTFQYQQNSWGQPSSVTLPTGAQISWTYTTGPNNDKGLMVTSRTVTVGGQSYVTKYAYGYDSVAKTPTTTVTDPAGNDVVEACTPYTPGYSDQYYVGMTDPPCYTTSMKYYQGPSANAANLIKTVTTGYNTSGAVLPQDEFTTWSPQNLVSRIFTGYDALGVQFCDYHPAYNCWTDNISWRNVTTKAEYDYGTGTYGPLLRTTVNSYLHLDPTLGPTYRAINIADKPTSVQVWAGASGSGTLMQWTKYAYDGYTCSTLQSTASAPAPSHDYTHYGNCYLTRGNPTQVSRGLYANSTWTWLNTKNTYDDLGNLLTSTDPNGNQTTYDYTDSWVNAGCVGTANTHAFVTTVTDALSHLSKKSYYSCTGLVQSSRDQNDINAGGVGTTFTYDLMNRISQKTLPDGGQSSFCYSEISGGSCYQAGAPFSITETDNITSTLNLVKTTVLDGLGRVQQTQLNSDPDGVTYVDTTYDSLDRKATESNAYRSLNDQTYGITSYLYDALGRNTMTIPPDGSSSSNNISTSYTSFPLVTVTDESGHSRKTQTDALGRLINVWEDPTGSNYQTSYQYDALGNMLCVEQRGNVSGTGCSSPPSNDATSPWRVRRFTYDSLSRLLTAKNPESGTIAYSYDADGNLLSKVAPAPNQTSTATVTTNYQYDALNRVTQKSYVGIATPTVKYGYDGLAPSGCTPPTLVSPSGSGIPTSPAYQVGRRSSMCDASGATAWVYDPVGRVSIEQRANNGITKNLGYTYYLNGEMSSLFYPSGQRHQFTITAAGRIYGVKDAQYNYVFGNATFTPWGTISSMWEAASTPQLYSQYYYNKRLQPVVAYSMVVSGTYPLIFSYCYDFHVSGGGTFGDQNVKCTFANSSSGNNGNLYQIINNLDNNRTQNFVYDNLNRISQAYTSGPNWGETFTIDAWANLTNKAGIAGKTASETLNAAPANITNRLPGFGYDAAGNMTSNGSAAYTYDAENRIVSTAGFSYVYDGDGKRVEKVSGSTGTLYWMGPSSDAVSESDLSGNINEEYVFFQGKRVARVDRPSGAVHYYFSDQLGSARVVTDAVGNVAEQSDYYPYGGEIVVTGSDTTHYKFTGKERDSESGLDDFGTRFYSSTLGRFSSPDPLIMSREVRDPQTLNKYSYAFNRPTVLVDPDGKWPGWYHHVIIEDAFGNLGAHAVHVLEEASDWVDSLSAGNQDPDRAFMHAMSNGAAKPPQSVADAEQQTNKYVDNELQAAVVAQLGYEAGGGQGNGDEALTRFGHALHTVTDRTSPQHAGYQGWSCTFCIPAYDHYRAEDRSAKSSNIADEQARHLAHVEAARLWERYQKQLQAARAKMQSCKDKPCPKK